MFVLFCFCDLFYQIVFSITELTGQKYIIIYYYCSTSHAHAKQSCAQRADFQGLPSFLSSYSDLYIFHHYLFLIIIALLLYENYIRHFDTCLVPLYCPVPVIANP